MIDKVVTGGQAGADQGALRAARAAGIATGGYALAGWVTEAGPAPWLAFFGLVELPGADTRPADVGTSRKPMRPSCSATGQAPGRRAW